MRVATTNPMENTVTLDQQHSMVTDSPGPRSAEWQRRRIAAVASGVSSVMSSYADAAGGGVVADVDGNQLIDLASGIAVTTVGNSAPAVVAAVTEQLRRFTHTCFMVTPYDSYVRVAEELNRLTPGEHDKRTALFNSGSEAVENAVKIARLATGRQAVVAFDHGYHGRTNLTMALTAKSHPYKTGFGPFAGEVYRAPLSYPFRDPQGMSGPEAAGRAISRIESQVGAQQTAAVVIEPIQGEGGFIVPAPGFLDALAAWCRRNGVVFIADEVQTGIARTGAMFASDHEHLVPDLVVSAKGLAGGLPLSAVTGRAEIMNAVHPGGLGGTYGGNPLACAAALAVFETVEREGLIDRAAALETRIRSHLAGWSDPRVGDVRGRGAMIGFELVHPGTLDPDPALTAAVVRRARQQGVIVLTCGSFDNVVRLLPPLSISDGLLDAGLDVLRDALVGR